MTTITLKATEIGNRLSVNGRFYSYDPRITEITKISGGRWEGIANGEPFEIIGGRASGGASNEWFVKWAVHGEMHIPTNSAKGAIDMIEKS